MNFLTIYLKVDLIIKNVEEMQESQQRLLDEQLQLSLDTNKTGLSISSHDSQIDLLEQYTKVYYFFIKNGTTEKRPCMDRFTRMKAVS